MYYSFCGNFCPEIQEIHFISFSGDFGLSKQSQILWVFSALVLPGKAEH